MYITATIATNTTKALIHYIDNNYEPVTKLLLKKGDYAHTYITIDVTGMPNGATLYLLDENFDYLYSPVDANGNWRTTQCYIKSGEINVIPLPARFNNNLSSFTHIEEGTYEWQLYYPESDTYTTAYIPFEVQIIDFNVWEVITPQIYPNENVKVQLKTYGNGIYPSIPDNMSHITNGNATYNSSSGVITYPNSDIITNVGKQTYRVPNSNCTVDYEVINPIVFFTTMQTNSGNAYNTHYLKSPGGYHKIGVKIDNKCTLKTTGVSTDLSVNIEFPFPYTIENGTYNTTTMLHNVSDLPPGTYHCTCDAKLSNGKRYQCDGSFTISTENCSLFMDYLYNDDGTYTLFTTYQYLNTPIHNAYIGLLDIERGVIIEATLTDEYGKVQWTVPAGVYQAIALNQYQEHLLESNILDFKHIYSIITDVSLDTNKDLLINNISTIDINYKVNTDLDINESGNLILTSIPIDTVRSDTQTIISISDNNGNISADIRPFSEIPNNTILNNISADDGHLYSDSISLEKVFNLYVVTNIEIDSNKDLIITKERYIDIEDKDTIMSEIKYNSNTNELIAKTIGDKKAELNT